MSNVARKPQPTIARIWRGRTPSAKADDYAEYLYEHGIKPLAEKALGVQMFREDRAGECEFVTISYWESIEAMSRFAGKDPRRIHHLERDGEFLTELPKDVQIMDIVADIGLRRRGGFASFRPPGLPREAGSNMARRCAELSGDRRGKQDGGSVGSGPPLVAARDVA
jgi:hypothetical protein